MTDLTALKQDLITHCTAFIEKQLSHVHQAIEVAKSTAKEESKSSAGDKHETGKSHLQLTQENNSKHLNNLQQQKRVIKLLEAYDAKDFIQLGSLVDTSNGLYFLAIGVGQVKVNDITVFIVSPASPVGKALMHKQVNELAVFNQLNLQIKEII